MRANYTHGLFIISSKFGFCATKTVQAKRKFDLLKMLHHLFHILVQLFVAAIANTRSNETRMLLNIRVSKNLQDRLLEDPEQRKRVLLQALHRYSVGELFLVSLVAPPCKINDVQPLHWVSYTAAALCMLGPGGERVELSPFFSLVRMERGVFVRRNFATGLPYSLLLAVYLATTS